MAALDSCVKGGYCMEYRIGHLAYRTGDMKAALDFYVGALGFKHAFSIPDDNNQPWIEYILTPDGRFIELFWPDTPGTPALGTSYMHLCLEVDDCAAAVKELESKGVHIDIYPNRGKDDNLQAWIKDPDGRPIEIMQLAETSPQFAARNG